MSKGRTSRSNSVRRNVLAAIAAKAATTTVPIVFATGSDPVRDGLVTSLNRPGGNVTGVSFFAARLGAKRLEQLRQLVPTATTIAVLVAPGSDAVSERRDLEAAAQTVGQQLTIFDVSANDDIETAFTIFAARRAGALLVVGGAFMFSNRERVVALAARHALPASYPVREFADGGLSQAEAKRLLAKLGSGSQVPGSLRSRPRYLRGGLYALRTLTACFRTWKISSWVNRRVSFTFWRTSVATTTPRIAAAAPGSGTSKITNTPGPSAAAP